jgi:hypothetical protein
MYSTVDFYSTQLRRSMMGQLVNIMYTIPHQLNFNGCIMFMNKAPESVHFELRILAA